jgi:REP element-mobilizing transposase RayT
MVRYRRNFVTGGAYFFTVTLADRHSTVLVDHVGALREAFRATRRERPFAIDAIVILPEHLHVLMTLPAGDADYSGRWRKIKSRFSRRVAGNLGLRKNPGGEYALWQRRFWSTRSATTRTSNGTRTTSTLTPSNIGLRRAYPIGRIHHFIATYALVFSQGTGRAMQTPQP